MEAKGSVQVGSKPFREAFEAIFDDPQERGAGVCVQVGGETVVDLWRVCGSGGASPWNHDTLVNTYCCIKPFTAIAALMLVEEGKLELDQTVAHYWPEFSQGGKERITLRQVFVPYLRYPGAAFAQPHAHYVRLGCNGRSRRGRTLVVGTGNQLSVMAPPPMAGSLASWFDGPTGRDPCTFIHERICEPNDLEVHMGVDAEHFHRIAFFRAR